MMDDHQELVFLQNTEVLLLEFDVQNLNGFITRILLVVCPRESTTWRLVHDERRAGLLGQFAKNVRPIGIEESQGGVLLIP